VTSVRSTVARRQRFLPDRFASYSATSAAWTGAARSRYVCALSNVAIPTEIVCRSESSDPRSNVPASNRSTRRSAALVDAALFAPGRTMTNSSPP